MRELNRMNKHEKFSIREAEIADIDDIIGLFAAEVEAGQAAWDALSAEEQEHNSRPSDITLP